MQVMLFKGTPLRWQK